MFDPMQLDWIRTAQEMLIPLLRSHCTPPGDSVVICLRKYWGSVRSAVAFSAQSRTRARVAVRVDPLHTYVYIYKYCRRQYTFENDHRSEPAAALQILKRSNFDQAVLLMWVVVAVLENTY